MRTHAVVAWFMVVSLFAAACASESEARVYTADELEPALLTAADLGSGWSEQTREVFDTRSPENPSIDPSMWCPDAADQAAALNQFATEAGAAVDLLAETDARRYHGVLEQAWNNTDVDAYFETATAGLATCNGANWTTEDGTVTVESTDAPTVGDESTSAVMVVTTEAPEGAMAWRVRFVMARFGATLMLLQELEVQPADADPLTTDAEWSEIVETAADKIGQLDSN